MEHLTCDFETVTFPTSAKLKRYHLSALTDIRIFRPLVSTSGSHPVKPTFIDSYAVIVSSVLLLQLLPFFPSGFAEFAKKKNHYFFRTTWVISASFETHHTG